MTIVAEKVRKFVLERKRYSDIYNNKQSYFVNKDSFRKDIFSVKSFLTTSKKNNDILYIPVNLGNTIADTYADYEVGQ